MLLGARPFDGPALWVGDTLRILCVVMGCVITMMAIRMAVNPAGRTYARATLSGIFACLALSVSAMFTEVGRLGHVVTWRLPINILGMGLVANYVRLLAVLPIERPTVEDRLGVDLAADLRKNPGLFDAASKAPERSAEPMAADPQWFVRFGVFVAVGAAVAALALTSLSSQAVSRLNANERQNARHLCQVLVKLDPKATCTVPK